jgi:hypothetical protein
MVETTCMVDARKTPISWPGVRRIIRNVDDIYITKGQKVIHIELKGGEQELEMLVRLLLRPSGNLRTPAFRRGRTLVVGFDEETYRGILSGG